MRNKSETLDWEYIESELDGLRLLEFERCNRNLAIHLFSGEGLSVAEEDMLSYMAESGTYGNLEHGVTNGVAKRGVLGYLIGIVFLPYRNMAVLFPILKRFPALLPICWTVRMGEAIVSKRKMIFHRSHAIIQSDKKENSFV